MATAVHHEFWRDEVHPLSNAMHSSTIFELVRSAENEGHPLLWHFLLYATYHATGSTLVLPVISILVAGAAVFLFIFFSPFPRWLKALFVFSGLPIYEYSVMARNYGISMLLLFTFAAAYPLRETHPLVLGFILALLCNTNIHSLVFAGLLMCFWMWDIFFTERRSVFSKEATNLYGAMAIMMAGGGTALYTVWPTEQMIIASDTARYTAAHFREALVNAIVSPATQFNELFPPWFPFKLRIISLLWAVIGLFVRPATMFIAYSALIILSVFFSILYAGSYRHQGLFVIFLVSLYWMVLDKQRSGPHDKPFKTLQVWLYGGLAILLASIVASGASHVYRDWAYQKSASKALAHEYLQTSPEYKDAILIGEPDFFLEAVPYYANNRLYIVREKRFGDTVRFVRTAQLNLSLGELLCAAWRIQNQEKKPVLIILGHRYLGGISWDLSDSPKSFSYAYQRTFSWSTEELAGWKRHTRLQRQFDHNVLGDEAYTVYSMLDAGVQTLPMCQ